MDRLERVGPDPTVRITPVWTISLDNPDGESPRHFSVIVEGMVEEAS